MKNSRVSASCSKILTNEKYIFSTVNSGHPLFFRASASCSKLLNEKSIFNAVKNSRATLFFRASASRSKILNNKKYIFSTVNSGHPLFFRASASCSKLLNVKIYSIQWKIPGQLCFQGKRKLLKILDVKSIFTTVKIFRATVFFRGSSSFSKIVNCEKFSMECIFTWGRSV